MRTGVIQAQQIDLSGQMRLRDAADNPGNYIGFVGPGTPEAATNLILEWPPADGESGSALFTDGAGTLFWASPPETNVFRTDISTLFSPSPGIFEVPHGLGETYVQVSVYAPQKKLVFADDIELIDGSTLLINLGSFLEGGSLPSGENPWMVVVIG